MIVFVGSIAAGVYVHLFYSAVMPHSPDLQTGRVHRIMVNHGDVVYVTQQELDRAHFVLNDLFTVAIACFGVLAILRIRFKNL
jgi:hypothetical protein